MKATWGRKEKYLLQYQEFAIHGWLNIYGAFEIDNCMNVQNKEIELS